MVEVGPFRGWRYDIAQVGSLSDVVAPPYDVIDSNEQKALYEQHPCNVVRLILNREEPGDDNPNARYERAAKFLKNWQQNGVLLQEGEEALYVYHQEFDWEGKHYVRKGFLGRLRLEEFGKGQVYPHEQTMPGPKADRLALIKACQMNMSPIFGLYPDNENVVQAALESAIAGQAALEATDENNVTHRYWPVFATESINRIKQLLHDKPVFIADGHHRYETAVHYRNLRRKAGKLSDGNAAANYALMMFVSMSDPGLAILPTHRLISGLPAISSEQMQRILADHFVCETMGTGTEAAQNTWKRIEAEGGQTNFGFGTASDDQWFYAELTDDSPMTKLAADQSDQWRNLGVSVLHRFVIEYLLDKAYPEAGIKPEYVHKMQEVTARLQDKSCQVACLVAPATIDHVEQIAAEFEKMPPKSTCFYPKLLSGLVFHELK